MTLLAREADVRRNVKKFYKSVGCTVVSFSFRRKVKQLEGLPDFWVMAMHRGGWWFEAKTPEGRQSRGQFEFQAKCVNSGVPYVLGGLKEAVAFWASKSPAELKS